jgi:hypothetical protein
MNPTRAGLAYTRDWLAKNSDACSRDFHNTLLRMPNPDVGKLIRLLQLFAVPPPLGRGKYQHHDGYRPAEPLNRRTT